jgi:hypothetical protein
LVSRTGKAFFGLWIAGGLVLGTLLLLRHRAALPSPAAGDSALSNSLAGLRTPAEQGRWMAVHVLYTSCRCSQRIISHLLEGERPAGVVEKVLLVGETGRLGARLGARGFAVTPIEPTELAARFHIEGAPLLLVVGPDGSVRYSGGYTGRKQGADVRDRAIIAAAMAGQPVDDLAVFGCAVSERLKQIITPLDAK